MDKPNTLAKRKQRERDKEKGYVERWFKLTEKEYIYLKGELHEIRKRDN